MRNVRRAFRWCSVMGLMTMTAGFGMDRAWAVQLATPTSPEDGIEVLTRGPVHEAFAGTAGLDREAGLVVQKQPPQAIEELPPDQRPDGDNVTWIPGYWAWDDERNDFLWVSGVWRNLPPGRQWVPGYWGQSDTDSQWISGYWADAQANEIEYLPEPPATVDVGPNIAAPSANHTWVPGSWVWQDNRYAWRPGFWAANQPNWVWTPASYVSTPRGHVFVDGYWDYPVARRGMLFAPVFFSPATFAQRGFSYSPSTAINPGTFMDNLFVRPQYQHYYFGDYEAANYRDAGFLRNRVGGLLGQASRSQASALQLRTVDQAERERLGQRGREIQRFRDQRQQWEARAASAATDSVRRVEEARVKLPTSPIAARPTERPGADTTPPKAHVSPPLDTLVRPQPRPSRLTEDQRRHTTLRPTTLDEPQTQPKVDGRDPPQIQQPPTVERPLTPGVQPQPRPQPKVEQPETPRVQPRPQPPRVQPQPQPRVERPAPPSQDRKPTGPPPVRSNPNENRNAGKGKSKDKN